MLVLTRRPGEAVMIGSEITVTVVEARGGKVRLAISAPREVAVHRAEVYQRIQRETSNAGGGFESPSSHGLTLEAPDPEFKQAAEGPAATVPRQPGAKVPRQPGAKVPRQPGAKVPRQPGAPTVAMENTFS